MTSPQRIARLVAPKGLDVLSPKPGPQIATGSIADSEKLRKYGFPARHVEAFSYTAERTNCVIACRAPGKATTELIESGHDLKSYLIKAKSCDWGPMSGFLCHLTCFNKAGSAKVEYNDDQYIHYYEYLRDNCIPGPTSPKKKYSFDSQLKQAIENGQTPFIALQFEAAHKQSLLKLIDEARKDPKTVASAATVDAYQVIDDDMVVGVAFDAKKTVAMEFMLKSRAGSDRKIWCAYHRNVWYRPMKKLDDGSEEAGAEWADFLDSKASHLTRAADGMLAVQEAKKGHGHVLRDFLKRPVKEMVNLDAYVELTAPSPEVEKFFSACKKPAGIPKGAETAFHPILAAQNPYPPYLFRGKHTDESAEAYLKYRQDEALSKPFYKNAVTGDYDLFAVFPVQPVVGWRDLVRLNDIRCEHPADSTIFVPLTAKPFALELRQSHDVYVEIIPDFEEIEAYEDREAGNINNAVNTVAGYLNSRVTSEIGKGGVSPNASFHSDEGGRPGIDEIDYEIAVFFPEAIATQLMPTVNGTIPALLINKHVQFLELIRLLSGKCYLMLNHIWLVQLFSLIDPKLATLAVQTAEKDAKKRKDIVDKRAKFIKDRKKEKAETDPAKLLSAEDLKTIEKELAALFLGAAAADRRLKDPGREDPDGAWTKLVEAFTMLAVKDYPNAEATRFQDAAAQRASLQALHLPISTARKEVAAALAAADAALAESQQAPGGSQ